MQQDLLSADELLGNIDSFTVEQRTARETFIKQELHLPREWICEDGCGVDGSPAGRVATGIYNTVVESGAADPRCSNRDSWQITGSFAGIIKDGGDALLWALIRIGLEECVSEDLAELCESHRSSAPGERGGDPRGIPLLQRGLCLLPRRARQGPDRHRQGTQSRAALFA